MKLGLRMAGLGAALLAGVVSTGTTVFASTASTGSTTATVASWDRSGDHNGGDRGHSSDRGRDGGDHRGGDSGRGGDRGHDGGDHRGGDGNRCGRDFRWDWNC
jgi:hypothetical protein